MNFNFDLKAVLKKREVTIFLGILAMFLTSTMFGLGDWDFRWQTYLGNKIITEGRFNAIGDLIWGTKGVATYIDHEWLTNVIFYFLNVVYGRTGSIIAFKVIIEFLLSFVTVCLIKQIVKDFNKIGYTTYLTLIIYVYVFAAILVKPKAYDISVLFVMIALILLEKYKEKEVNFKLFSIATIVLVILWNNFHSGSIVFMILLYGAYWLVCFRDIKTILLGLVSLVCLLITPFGIKLLLFDMEHFSDSVMTTLIRDWHYLDLKMATGKAVLFLLIVIFLYCLNLDKRKDFVYILLFIGTSIMTISSMRHFLYCYPIGIMIISKGQYEDIIKIKGNVINTITYLVCVFSASLLIFFALSFNDVKQREYGMDYIGNDLQHILIDTNKDTNDGLFNAEINVWSCGLKSFQSGAFPHARQRVIDGYVLLYGSNKQIDDIIQFYDLTKFLFYKDYKDDSGYTLNTPLYDYLIDNQDYELLYDNGILVYFVEKRET